MVATSVSGLHIDAAPPEVAVRPLRRADMDTVAAVEQRSFRAEAWPRELLEEYAAERGVVFLVGLVAGQVVAYSIACGKAARGEVASIAVDPSWRRSGVGRALLASSLRRLRRRGVTRVSLMVRVENRRAMRLYAAFGFAQVRRVARYYEDGGDGYLMARKWD